ncbi:MAG: hypothetical protein ABSC72_08070 [Methylovirgula sp.]|jgi:hypothetical protein
MLWSAHQSYAATHATAGRAGFSVFSGHVPHAISPMQQAHAFHHRFGSAQFGGEGLPQLYSGTIEIPSYDEAAGDYDDEDGAVLPPIYMIPRVRTQPRCVVPLVIELRKTAEHHKLPKVSYGTTNTCPPWVLEARH